MKIEVLDMSELWKRRRYPPILRFLTARQLLEEWEALSETERRVLELETAIEAGLRPKNTGSA